MPLKRNHKSAILAIAVLVIGAIGWRLPTPSKGKPPALLPLTTPSGASSIVAASRAVATAQGSFPPAVSAVVNRVDDVRCVVKPVALPAEAVADAASDAPQVADRPGVAPDPARARILARMASSSDPYANAVAVWLGIADEPEPDPQRIAERLRRLTAMAASTQDPRVYALALRTCWGRATQACDGLSARRWAEIDPDNAMPWLMMLDDSGRHGDVSGLQEAMFHATRARRLAERDRAHLQPIIDMASSDPESLLAARALAVDAIGIAAAQVGPIGYTACKGASRDNANVWQQCVALVDLLENRSDSLYARQVGASIDRRLTGNAKPGERVAAQMTGLMTLDLASSSGCGDLRAKLALLRRMAIEGEAAATADLAP